MQGTSTVLLTNIAGDARTLDLSPGKPTRALLDQFVQENVNPFNGDIGHHHHMGNAALAGELPPADELLISRPLKHHGAAKLVEHCPDPRTSEAVLQVVGIPQASLNFLLESHVALPV